MRPKAIAIVLALLGAPALQAACPGPTDLATGIVATTSDGQVEVHKIAARNIVQVDIRYNDGTGDGSVMQFGHGLYLRNVIPIEGGVLRLNQQEKFASDATLRAWQAPAPSSQWSNQRSDGGAASAGPVFAVKIGKCTYDGFDVTLTFADDPNYVEIYTYVPALGIGLLTNIIEGGTRDRYRYVSIAKK